MAQRPFADMRHLAAALACAVLAACAAPEPPLPDYRNVVISEDRTRFLEPGSGESGLVALKGPPGGADP